jgi:hypothetical protein
VRVRWIGSNGTLQILLRSYSDVDPSYNLMCFIACTLRTWGAGNLPHQRQGREGIRCTRQGRVSETRLCSCNSSAPGGSCIGPLTTVLLPGHSPPRRTDSSSTLRAPWPALRRGLQMLLWKARHCSKGSRRLSQGCWEAESVHVHVEREIP